MPRGRRQRRHAARFVRCLGPSRPAPRGLRRFSMSQIRHSSCQYASGPRPAMSRTRQRLSPPSDALLDQLDHLHAAQGRRAAHMSRETMKTISRLPARPSLLPIGEVAAQARHPGRGALSVRPRQGQGRLRLSRTARRATGRQAGAGDRDHPDARRRGQDHHDGGPRRRRSTGSAARRDLPARALARPLLRHEGRRRRWRLRPGRADGGHQPPLHRRLPCDRQRQQPARGANRQPPLLGQRARARCAPDHLAPGHGHERSRAALDRQLPGRRRQRLPARGRLRHHGRLRGHGDLLPGPRPAGPRAPPRQRHRRLYPRAPPGHRGRPQGAGADGGPAQGRADAEPGADAREQPGLHPRRPVRQHRPWLQLGDRHPDRAQARRLRGHRGGLRRRSRRREVLRHQMPQGGARRPMPR